MRRTLGILSITFILVGIASSAAAQDEILVKPHPHAQLTAEGTLLLDVRVKCAAEGEVLEAFVDVTQDDQTISGQGTISGIVCDGHWRKHAVTVQVFEGEFHPGRARASAFVLVCTETDCADGQAVKFLQVR